MSPSAGSWQRVAVTLRAEDVEAAVGLCFDCGSSGVEVIDETGDRTAIIAYFENEPPSAHRPLRSTLKEALSGSAISPLDIDVDAIADRDWNAEWRRFYKEVWPTPNLVVHPPWIEVETSPGDIAIAIEPAMAFGTGTHESTQLCLEALAATKPRGQRCLDVGTGTGILAIAAIKLGAREVVAIDVDSDALNCARENVEANLGSNREGAGGIVRVLHGSVEAAGDGPFDVIAANLESRFQLPIMPHLRKLIATDGRILFSGLLASEGDRFESRLCEAGLAVVRRWERNGWLGISTRPL